MDWADRAKCFGADVGEFYLPRGAKADYARSVCAGCPVIQECLEYALDNFERYGIWGGASSVTRSRISKSADRDAAISAHILRVRLEFGERKSA